jgi:hypothetical protein
MRGCHLLRHAAAEAAARHLSLLRPTVAPPTALKKRPAVALDSFAGAVDGRIFLELTPIA